MTALLDIQGVSISFGGLKAVSDFSLKLERGDLHGLIGPNGAGKTTVFNLLTGVYRPQSGSISLEGESLLGLRPHPIALAGLSRTFQNIRLFPDLSVEDNVRMAFHLRSGCTMLGAIARSGRQVGEERAMTEEAGRLLDVMGLRQRRRELGRNLCYGDQRRIEMARALATGPKVLLLDEPAAGMNSTEKQALRGLIRDVQSRFGVTILLIEHDMGVVMDVCRRITVLDHGVIIAEGTPNQVQCHPAVIEAYLGTSGAAVAPASNGSAQEK